MDMTAIRAAVIGVGFIGVAHVEALRRIGVDVVGVLGSTPERGRAKATAAGLPPAYDSLEQLLDDERVQVVHVTSPNSLHAEQVRAVIASGRHVVCEKPLAVDAADAHDLDARARAAGVVNAVCFNLRFYPLNHQMRAMVADGAIGSPHMVSGAYLQDWLLLDTDWNWRLVAEQAGALRAIADIGSHWFDLSQFILGRRIVEVMADLRTVVPVRRHPAGPVETFATSPGDEALIEEAVTSDDAAGVLLRYEGGATGVVTVSQVSAGRKNAITIEVDGSRSSLSWFSEDPDRLLVGHRGRANEVLHRDPSLLAPSAAAVAGYPGGHVEGYPDTFRALFREVYADVARGGPAQDPTYPTFADGADVLAVTEAVATSSREGRWTPVVRPTP